MTVIYIEYVDHGAQDEYGFFGRVVARSDVRGFTATEIDAEIVGMRAILGDHVAARFVEEVAAI